MAEKLSQESVGFEHPANGPNHCGECEHFEAPHSCEIVRGHIDRGDWCRRFKRKPQSRAQRRYSR